MYLPPHFAEQRRDVLEAFIRKYPLATVITSAPVGFGVSHIPLVLHPSEGPLGCLRGHFARANPQYTVAPSPARAVFHGPHAYVTPEWYPTKAETGRVVPTWIYVTVHVAGSLTVIDDRDFLYRHLQDLTNAHEGARRQPWTIEEAPPDYMEATLKRIVGFEIAISRFEGKWKLDQNQPARNRAGLVNGLRQAEEHVLSAMVRQARPPFDGS
jgi:transcriptional regulator